MIYVVRYTPIAIHTVIWGTICGLLAILDRSGEGALWGAKQWVRWILWTCGIEVSAEGHRRLAIGRPRVWMSNHQSVFDIAAIIFTLPPEISFRFVAKRGLAWIPFFGWALDAGVPIAVSGSGRVTPKGSLRIERGRVRVCHGDPIEAAGRDAGDRMALQRRCARPSRRATTPITGARPRRSRRPVADDCGMCPSMSHALSWKRGAAPRDLAVKAG